MNNVTWSSQQYWLRWIPCHWSGWEGSRTEWNGGYGPPYHGPVNWIWKEQTSSRRRVCMTLLNVVLYWPMRHLGTSTFHLVSVHRTGPCSTFCVFFFKLTLTKFKTFQDYTSVPCISISPKAILSRCLNHLENLNLSIFTGIPWPVEAKVMHLSSEWLVIDITSIQVSPLVLFTGTRRAKTRKWLWTRWKASSSRVVQLVLQSCLALETHIGYLVTGQYGTWEGNSKIHSAGFSRWSWRYAWS